MYNKRGHMETLKQYRRYPHIETRLLKTYLYAALHCQLRRLAIRCSEIYFSYIAAAKLMMDMIRHDYAKDRVRRNLLNFRKILSKTSPTLPTVNIVHDPVVRDKYRWLVTERVGHVSKRKLKLPGMTDVCVMSGYVFARYLNFQNIRLNFRSYTSFMGLATSRVPHIFMFTKCLI